MKIALASDHAGYRMKECIKEYLIKKGYLIEDFGCNSEVCCDYPDFAHPFARAIEKGDFELGFSFCGSGNGINITANKYSGVRSALCWDIEPAELARKHNNANVCALPARFLNDQKAEKIVDAFLNSQFEGGRHKRRIDKIPIK
jgi:ribose 5-phosphate isomerase B